MKITIYSLCWNEEIILPYFFKYYKEKFQNAEFVIYDNMSDDNSRQIIKEQGGQIIDFVTANESREDIQMEIRNNCWKNAQTDWVIVCDIDEFLDIDETSLFFTKNTIFKSEGYEMVGNTYNIDEITLGTRNDYLDKCILFNKKYISEINYSNGCHDCFPTGTIIYNKERIILRHRKYFKLEYVIDRFSKLSSRLSKENLDNGWSLHYLQNKSEIIKSFSFLYDNRRKVPLSFFYYHVEIFLRKRKKITYLNTILKKIIYLPKGVKQK